MYFGDFGNDKAISVAKLKSILENISDDRLIKTNDDHLIVFSGMAPETGSSPIAKIEFGIEEYKELKPR